MVSIPVLTLDLLAESPWAIERVVLSQLVSYAQRGETIVAAQRPQRAAPRTGAIAVIPIRGMIEHRSSFLMDLFGGTSVEDIRAALRAAMADPQVSSIVLDIDSPGGGIAGITELAAEIRAARSQKRIVAVANTIAASAAYWLGSQADQFLVTASGQVGSIGIYAVHFDISRALEQEGVTPTIITAGEHKGEGLEFQPLTDDARASMQRRVDAFYNQFIGDVAKGRRVDAERVRSNYGQGTALLAPDALRAGMVDGIGTFDDALRVASKPMPVALRAEGGEPEPIEVDLPFRVRVEHAAEELTGLVEHAAGRARLRAKEGRPAFSETTHASLRSIRDTLSDLLAADDPSESAVPSASVAPPAVEPSAPVVPVQVRFRDTREWLSYLEAAKPH